MIGRLGEGGTCIAVGGDWVAGGKEACRLEISVNTPSPLCFVLPETFSSWTQALLHQLSMLALWGGLWTFPTFHLRTLMRGLILKRPRVALNAGNAALSYIGLQILSLLSSLKQIHFLV